MNSRTPEWKVTGESYEYWNVSESVEVPPDWVTPLMEPGDVVTRPVCRVKKSAGKERLAMILESPKLLTALIHCHDWILSQQRNGRMDGEDIRLEAKAIIEKAKESP
jgi:quinol-cytochrome oxidoreductase complex cytochrome b subunit